MGTYFYISDCFIEFFFYNHWIYAGVTIGVIKVKTLNFMWYKDLSQRTRVASKPNDT